MWKLRLFLLVSVSCTACIVGIGEANFPFLAKIHKTTNYGSYFCAGSLISQRWVVTAGQCVEDAIVFTIHLGTRNIKLVTGEYILHPEYDALTLENDVGLIKVGNNVTYNGDIEAISLNFFDVSTNLQIAAWKLLSKSKVSIFLSTASNDECKFTYGNEFSENIACVIGRYNEEICQGDIGTPILYYLDRLPLLQGIVTFVSAHGCESADPFGYTKIFPYIGWIENIINNNK